MKIEKEQLKEKICEWANKLYLELFFDYNDDKTRKNFKNLIENELKKYDNISLINIKCDNDNNTPNIIEDKCFVANINFNLDDRPISFALQIKATEVSF